MARNFFLVLCIWSNDFLRTAWCCQHSTIWILIAFQGDVFPPLSWSHVLRRRRLRPPSPPCPVSGTPSGCRSHSFHFTKAVTSTPCAPCVMSPDICRSIFSCHIEKSQTDELYIDAIVTRHFCHSAFCICALYCLNDMLRESFLLRRKATHFFALRKDCAMF